MPKKVIGGLTAIHRNFLWRGPSSKGTSNSFYLIAWNKVTKPRLEGGYWVERPVQPNESFPNSLCLEISPEPICLVGQDLDPKIPQQGPV